MWTQGAPSRRVKRGTLTKLLLRNEWAGGEMQTSGVSGAAAPLLSGVCASRQAGGVNAGSGS